MNAIEARMDSLEVTRDPKAEELKDAVSPRTLWRLDAEIASLNAQIQAEILRGINKRWEISHQQTVVRVAQNHYIFTQLNHDMAMRHLDAVKGKLSGLLDEADQLIEDIEDARGRLP